MEGQSTSLPVALDPDGARLGILAGARVQLAGASGQLTFVFDARHHFLRILGQPGPVPSFETYAFDRSGLMLSNSRFPHHLHQSGLLPGEACQTPLRLRVAEPSGRPRAEWPLTRMARDATQQNDGMDTKPYLDYRGTPVVGAWRWIPRYGFGVTAEVDHHAPFASRPGG